MEKNNSRETVNFVLLNDRQIRRINQQFLRHDRATDVIAFASLGEDHFGEILISVDTARRQAKVQRHSLLRELQILAIHGVLHLLGYDDHRPADRARMWRRTEALLKKVENR